MRWRSVSSAASIATPSHDLYSTRPMATIAPKSSASPARYPAKKTAGTRHAGRAHERGDRVVVEHEAILRVQDRAIARKQVGIEMLRDGRDVERLIADAVAVTAAVEDGDEAKRHRACGERRRF